ncbi:hypothetical protein ED733_001548 [Metarhizium rileyi]|uniref:Homeobox domain-containing protein n=1 Tax=Metarhizium rileyi (strain RCEF 4871) TaxID=1649241 RepID=A0A5C6G898_METRR|nr:hypothetical protein ED733_001548 [Metarhizium rileyi]
MSEKQSLPSPLEPEWQGQYSYYPHVETDSYQRSSADKVNSLSRHSTKAATSFGHQLQTGEFKRDGDTPDTVSRNGSANQQGNRLVPSLHDTTNTCLKLLDTVSRDNLGTESFQYPRPTDASSNLYRSRGDQTPGTDLSHSDRDDKEQSLSQDADFDVFDEDGDDIDRGIHDSRLTAAERLAARRKMKRFRLTHQQTRFLMSEFAKQPHPDAAHRERLSHEIPGLSPRQVQVWFQNRRAKIKRLRVDDRDRMVQMRAVPDDFDNVQALHSPYGAVNGLGTSVSTSGLGSTGSPYGNQGVKALLLDLRKPVGDSYMSPSGLSQSFGGIDIDQSGPVAHSEIPTSSSSMYGDRYVVTGGSSAASTPGLGYRSSASFWNATANTMDVSLSHHRSEMRDSQPLQRREWNSRHTPDTAQAPLSFYQSGATSASNSSDRQISYPGSSAGTSGDCEPQAYLDQSSLPSRGTVDSTGLEESNQSRSGSPPASTTAPLAIEFNFKDPFRALSASAKFPDRSQGLPPLKADTSSLASYATGPLSAPLNLPRQQPFHVQTKSYREYTASQLSAPIQAPGDFTRLFRAPTPNRDVSSRPLKDLFGHGVL